MTCPGSPRLRCGARGCSEKIVERPRQQLEVCLPSPLPKPSSIFSAAGAGCVCTRLINQLWLVHHPETGSWKASQRPLSLTPYPGGEALHLALGRLLASPLYPTFSLLPTCPPSSPQLLLDLYTSCCSCLGALPMSTWHSAAPLPRPPPPRKSPPRLTWLSGA